MNFHGNTTGSGAGGRGGDIGSYNHNSTSHANSHNDNSIWHRSGGDNYCGPIDKGDTYNGTISNSAVGGRGNSNELNNYGSSRNDEKNAAPSALEIELTGRFTRAVKKLAEKKERAYLEQLEAEVVKLEAKLVPSFWKR